MLNTGCCHIPLQSKPGIPDNGGPAEPGSYGKGDGGGPYFTMGTPYIGCTVPGGGRALIELRIFSTHDIIIIYVLI
jgi:hypothetical protein